MCAWLPNNLPNSRLVVSKNFDMSDLEKRLTPVQVKKLQAAGLGSLYDLVTYLPLGVFRILPLTAFKHTVLDHVKYLDQAVLEQMVQRRGQRNFLQLQWLSRTTQRRYQAYFFPAVRFTWQALQVGQEFQLLLTYRNGFWNLEKFAKVSHIQESNQLLLGTAQMREYLDVYYPKLGLVSSNYLKSIHRRLQPEDYRLHLGGLVVDNPYIPQVLDLQGVHHPTTLQVYQTTFKQWLSLQFYLKLALIRYAGSLQKQEFGRAATLDLDFVRCLVRALPFELSASQKQAIWEILQDMCLAKSS